MIIMAMFILQNLQVSDKHEVLTIQKQKPLISFFANIFFA